jgi:hypothetical protein
MINAYLPSAFIVILSWLSFWLSYREVATRVFVGLLAILATMVIGHGASTTIPRVTFITAMNVWMGVCHLFIFASLVEFIVVVVLSRRNGSGANIRGEPVVSPEEERAQPQRVVKTEGQDDVSHVGVVSRIAFPLAFIIFNVIYWIYYKAV